MKIYEQTKWAVLCAAIMAVGVIAVFLELDYVMVN
jgi:hypothetical protein